MILKSSKLTKVDKKEAIGKIFEESTPNWDFFAMLALSSLIVTLGLLIDSSPIVIGGMLIAPILFPIMSFSMGIVVGNPKLIRRSSVIIGQSVLTVILFSFAISTLTNHKEVTAEIFSRIQPNLAYLLIAIFSGAAVAYALLRPSVSEILPGIAVSVALIPPLAALGISISMFEREAVVGSFQLFLLNFVGITFASIAVFSFARMFEVKDVIERRLKGEEKVYAKEKKEKEKEHIEELEKKLEEVTEVLQEKKKGK